jgi:hypothetical protein
MVVLILSDLFCGLQVDIYSLSRKWKELVDKARAKQLQPQEYSTGKPPHLFFCKTKTILFLDSCYGNSVEFPFELFKSFKTLKASLMFFFSQSGIPKDHRSSCGNKNDDKW